jgi:diacylglycerol kinase (ATP)
VDNFADLEAVRQLVATIQENKQPRLVPDWCFLDCVTAERFFRIDTGQENIHFLLDVCEDHLFILEMEHEDMEELQNNLTITPLLGEDMTPPRSPLTPSPSPFDMEIDSRADIPLPRKPEERPTPMDTQPIPTLGVTPPEGGNTKTTDGILKAARLGDLKMLTELFEQGYSLLSMDETGKTGLHYGARFGHKDIIHFFLENGPSDMIDRKDNEKGHTALHKAAAYKRRTICIMLVNAGASLAIEDHCQQSARQLALSAEDKELCDFLEERQDRQENFQVNCNEDYEDSCCNS